MPTVTDQAEREKQAWVALYDHMQRSLVFIVEGGPNEPSAGQAHGSGTLVRSDGGRVVVLTSAHVVDNTARGYSLGGREIGDPAIGAPFASIWKHPNEAVDVAVALLTAEAASAFGLGALALDSIAATDVELEPTDPTVICGFPAVFKSRSQHPETGADVQGFAAVTYNTCVVGFDDRKSRYMLAWDEGVVDHDPDNRAQALGLDLGKINKQPLPNGISGGPLWRLRPTKLSEVWVASRAATIIGVCESWDKVSVQFCPAVRIWGDWFREILATIDSTE